MSTQASNLIRNIKVSKIIKPILTVVLKAMTQEILKGSMMLSPMKFQILLLKKFNLSLQSN